ncbi:hypothetical protein H0H81_007185 [Sphagnurus paluster]|uniref:Uncharacterized protein n=1 Tax=Sphagnurus paluster TaxID=117069 RepID=A0A9P7KKY6_9AGAR|nr:hypothetical protein H0H81_007185 [Sphagnurus paluster]
MKRSASLDHIPPEKRAKIQTDLSDLSLTLERDPNELLEHQSTSLSGYLSCSCVISWELQRKNRIIVQTVSPQCRFEVELVGQCIEFLPAIQPKPSDEFLLFLNGAQVVKLEEPAADCDLPVKLIYNEGITIKFFKRHKVPCSEVVDTWQLKQHARLLEDTWFNTPPLEVIDDISHNQDSITGPSAHHIATTSLLAPSHSSTTTSDSVTTVEIPERKVSKKQRRKMRKAMKNQSANSNSNLSSMLSKDIPSVPTTTSCLSEIASVHPILEPPADYTGISTINVSFKLADPIKTNVAHVESFTVNCFSDHEQLLPKPELGEILILRDVKILHVQKTHQCYIVYVTDYTANEKLAAVTGPWCPPALAGRVAMMEAWSGAVDFVANMSTGEYYWIKNVRMKELGDGALIGKLNDNNFQELKEGDDLNRNLHSLLE